MRALFWLWTLAVLAAGTAYSEPPRKQFALSAATVSGFAARDAADPQSALFLRIFTLEANGQPRLLGQSQEIRTWAQQPASSAAFPSLVLETGASYVVKIYTTNVAGERMIDETPPFSLSDRPGRVLLSFQHGGAIVLPIVGAGLAETLSPSRERFELTSGTVTGLTPVNGAAKLIFKLVAYEGAGVTRAVLAGESREVALGPSVTVSFARTVLKTRVFYVVKSVTKDETGEHDFDQTAPFELSAEPGLTALSFAHGGRIELDIPGASLIGKTAKARQFTSLPLAY